MTNDNDKYYQLLTVNDVCRRIRVTRPTFYALAKKGHFEILKFGRYSRVRESDLIRFIDAMQGEVRCGNCAFEFLGRICPQCRTPYVDPPTP